MHGLLYLHYRATTGDPWILSPPFPLSAPATASGAIPLASFDQASGIEALPPEDCLFSSDLGPLALDNYLALSVTTIGLVKSEADLLLGFLIAYKNAALHEVQFSGYLDSAFHTATIGRIEQFGERGNFHLRFRLASQISS